MTRRTDIILNKRVVLTFHPFLILSLLLQASLPAAASFSFNKNLEKAYYEITSLRIASGKQIVAQEIAADPNNGIAIYLENYAEALEVFISEDPALYKKHLAKVPKRLDKLNKLEKTSVWQRFCVAEIKIQWAFVKLKFKDETSAVLDVRSAYKLLVENGQLNPSFSANKKSLGLLNVLIGSVPENYQWAVNAIGMTGDITDGIKLLKEVANGNTIYNTEASLILILVDNFILQNEKKDFNDIRTLYTNYPDNMMITFVYSNVLIKNSNSATALEILKKRKQSNEYHTFPFMNYMMGEALLQQGSYSGCREYYLKYLSEYKGKNFVKDSYYKLFLSYWLTNEDQTAQTYIAKILNHGQAYYDSDKHAQRFAENKEMPDKTLMKVRLFTDGGFYDKATEILNQISMSSFQTRKDKIEYTYRTARLYHKTGKLDTALEYYKKTIELSLNTNYYFAPNSALQMGYIYKSYNNKEEAISYFEKAMSYKNHEYKNSIDNKAKAEIAKLKK